MALLKGGDDEPGSFGSDFFPPLTLCCSAVTVDAPQLPARRALHEARSFSSSQARVAFRLFGWLWLPGYFCSFCFLLLGKQSSRK